ncbi:adenylyltransferase/cytidyltransferase family protein [Pseudomonas sp. B21-032]|uniref:adenylyltransferase/cytidyltransferase family protein n=1 Tax=Pseudomonas sp. B21-032 TaxID=2895483 RepID=UPI0038D3DFDA
MLSFIQELETLRSKCLTIGYTSGVFDLLHQGHLDYIYACRNLCDILVLGVDSDARVQISKGNQRPFQTVEDRIHTLKPLVNFVFEKRTASIDYIRQIKPNVHFYSASRIIESSKIHELSTLNNFKHIHFIQRNPNYSTTEKITKILIARNQENKLKMEPD